MQRDQGAHANTISEAPRRCCRSSRANADAMARTTQQSVPVQAANGLTSNPHAFLSAVALQRAVRALELSDIYANPGLAGHNVSSNSARAECISRPHDVSDAAAQGSCVKGTHESCGAAHAASPDGFSGLHQAVAAHFKAGSSADAAAISRSQQMQLRKNLCLDQCGNKSHAMPVHGVPPQEHVPPLAQVQNSTHSSPCKRAECEGNSPATAATSLVSAPPAEATPAAKRPRGRARKKPLLKEPQVAVQDGPVPPSPRARGSSPPCPLEIAKTGQGAQARPRRKAAAAKKLWLLESKGDESPATPSRHTEKAHTGKASTGAAPSTFQWNSLQQAAMQEFAWSADQFQQVADSLAIHAALPREGVCHYFVTSYKLRLLSIA